MPKIKRPILEADQFVVRPVAIGVIQEVLIDRMKLSPNLTINFPGPDGVMTQPKGLISNPYEDNRFPTTDKLFVDVTERYIEHLKLTNVVDKPEHMPLFLNRDLELEMRPVYASVEMRITMRYRARSRTEAKQWYDYMMMKIPVNEDTWLHEISYSFAMPPSYLVVLREIHRLTELRAGYGETFEEFFDKWVHPRHGLLTDQTGKNTIGVFSDTQIRCLGFFESFADPDLGNRKDETDVWEVEIPYVLRYEKPVDIWFSYPVVVHNTVLSKKFRGEKGFERLQDKISTRTWSLAHLKSFESMENVDRHLKDFPGRYFPLFDEFMPRMVPPKTIRVCTALVLLGDEPDDQPNLLMNLTELEGPEFGMKFNECVKNFITNNYETVTSQRQSAVHLALYSNRLLMDDSWIRIDEDLNIWSTRPLDKRRYYHVRISIVTDLKYLSEDGKTQLKEDPCALDAIIDYILPEGVPRPTFPTVKDNDKVIIPDNDFDRIIDDITKVIDKTTPTTFGRLQSSTMKTVQFTRVNAVYEMTK